MTHDDGTRDRHWTCARRLRERRRTLALTQLDVVDRLRQRGAQTTNRALSSMENGRGLDLGLLPDLAGALDCSITYLLGLTEDPHAWQPDPRTDPVSADAALPEPVLPESALPESVLPEPASADPDRSTGSWILGPDVPDARPPIGLAHRHDSTP